MKRAPIHHPAFLIIILLFSFLITGCKESKTKHEAQGSPGIAVTINPNAQTIKQRVSPPKGYQWITEPQNSFGEYLQNAPLKEDGSPILSYTGQPIANQSNHIAVLDYDIGNKDLQQCADAVIRLNAEYLYQQNKFDEISYQFTNGDTFSWNQYKNGIRPQLINDNTVNFVQSAGFNDSYEAFRKYLDIIFMYAGTISLNRETIPVQRNEDIKAGDILITPGSPGHVVVIVGHAKNSAGKSVYLLAEGYTPAQSIHIINNPENKTLNPWYELDVNKPETHTARYYFYTNIRAFR
ncbi:MAG: DUF4846 domain-containing protein [Flavobacteriia bacterium]|nr:DUF4846 domain-containing protein [Flavobacteriia bacterium]